MKFLITIYVNPEVDAAWAGELSAEMDRAHTDLQTELRAAGEMIAAAELDPDGAKIVRVTDGSSVVTDGPFTEGREVTGGYYLVDVADLDRALAIAARFVEARYSPVEVRRLVEA